MRFEDLPPKMQQQVRDKLGHAAEVKAKKDYAATVKTNGWCFGCGVRFTSSAKWEQHSDETGHTRFVLIPHEPPDDWQPSSGGRPRGGKVPGTDEEGATAP